MQDLTGRGRFTLFEWAIPSKMTVDAVEGVVGFESTFSSIDSMTAGP
jgi:hypothetical protein